MMKTENVKTAFYSEKVYIPNRYDGDIPFPVEFPKKVCERTLVPISCR